MKVKIVPGFDFFRLMIDDLNSFIRKRVTVKSNDLTSQIFKEKTSQARNPISNQTKSNQNANI